jgi:hypothetical protein
MTQPKRRPHMCLFFVLAPLVLAGHCGCSQVRLIRKSPDGGVVTMPNNTNQWPTYYRNRAETLMRQKCPDGYVIDGEKLVADNPAVRDGRKPTEDFDYNGAYIKVTHFQRKVYQISFHSAPPGAPPPLPLPAPRKKPAARPPAAAPPPPADEGKQELPPPRRLPPQQVED